jgi:RNA polymerase sigma-70 factor (ECF subfamily)
MQTAYTFAETSGPCPTSPARQRSDAVLLASIAQGDRRAMQLLFGRHNVRVYRFMTRITGNQAVAEDLISDVFVDVWRHAGNFKGSPRSAPGCSASRVTRRCPRSGAARAFM